MRRISLSSYKPWLTVLSAAACLAGLLISAQPASAASLTSVSWTTTKSMTSATAATYSYKFTAATTSSLSSVTMTVPSGTAGTPVVGTVTPAALAGGTIALAGTTLTYTFTATSVTAGQAVSIGINGITNTATAGAYTSVVTTRTGATSVDTGTSGTVTITTGTLGSPTWAASSTTTGATGVTYTYGFSNLLAAFTSITMTVPPGTSGTPAIGATSGITLGSVSLTGTTLTVSVVSVNIGNVSISITGLTNTPIAGTYASEIVATPLLGSPTSGITAGLTFSGPLTLTSPGALGWSGIITGSAQSVRDGTAAHQQFSLDDERGTGAGWHLTVSATTFVSGVNSLPNAGTFVFTGSLTSVTATTAPSTSCNPSCTKPVTTTTYPVAITTAAVSPVPATVFNAAVGSGTGPMIIGGSAATSPIGWWINVPAAARAGSYTSTITVAAVSGP